MSSSHNDFADVRKLLSLKRHEVPPPGYFDRFSQNVIARLKEEQAGRAEDEQPAWLQAFWALFENRPAFAGVFGLAMCSLLAAALFISGQDAGHTTTSAESMVVSGFAANPAAAAMTPAASVPVESVLFRGSAPAASTEGVMPAQEMPSLFQRQSLQTQPAFFSQPANR